VKVYVTNFMLFALGLYVFIGGIKYNRGMHKSLSNIKQSFDLLEQSRVDAPIIMIPIQWLISKFPWFITRTAIIFLGLVLMILSFIVNSVPSEFF